jgi:hypothetical protein
LPNPLQQLSFRDAVMTTPPPCRQLGRHCRELHVTASVASLRDDQPPACDGLATWLLGHTERISFGTPHIAGQRMVVDAVVHVPCKYLQQTDGAGAHASCTAHGFVGPLPDATRPQHVPARQHDDGTVSIVHRGRLERLALAQRPAPRRALPVIAGANPCLGAPCRTADNTQGAACCRDLTLEVLAPAEERPSDRLEALLRARRAPYLCKVERADAEIIECEVISACGYLGADHISCVLHDRRRPDGRPAKPRVCSRWPDLGPDDVGHPGCVLLPTARRKT